jgi:mannose-6-phosphate isomerase-like protein (cupin superfamily)
MSYQAINFRQKFELFTEHWAPKVLAEMNDYQIKIVKLRGDFIWHHHKDTDETFIVIEGDLRIDFRDGNVHLTTGEMLVVPRGVEHKPCAENEVKLLLIEPPGVLNTGHQAGSRNGKERRLHMTAPGNTYRRVGVSACRGLGVSRQSHRLPYFFLMRTNRSLRRHAHTCSLRRRVASCD